MARWSLRIRGNGDNQRFAAERNGERVTGWFKDFWRLYSRMVKDED